MQAFWDFDNCYENKDVVQILVAMFKIIDFYHNQGIDVKAGMHVTKFSQNSFA